MKDKEANRRVVVTGGCGFIGTHLVRYLASRNYEVIVIDNMSTGIASRNEELISGGVIKVFEADVCDQTAIKNLFKEIKPWAIAHLAAPVSVGESKSDPDKYFRTIVDGTYNVVAGAHESGASRFLNLNSAAVYGRASTVPTPETYGASPNNPYGVAKWVGEQAAIHYCRIFGIGCISLRLMNLYGEYASALFGLFVKQKKEGEKLTVTGDGSQLRDFTYVGDIAKAIELALASELDGEVLNVGTGKPISVIEMAKLFQAPIKFIVRQPDEPDIILGSIGKLKKLLPNALPITRPEEIIPQMWI